MIAFGRGNLAQSLLCRRGWSACSATLSSELAKPTAQRTPGHLIFEDALADRPANAKRAPLETPVRQALPKTTTARKAMSVRIAVRSSRSLDRRRHCRRHCQGRR